MDVISYALSKKIASSAVSGVSAMSVDGTTLNIDTNDGQRLQMSFPTPKDGVSIVDIEINANRELVCTMSDNSTIVAGVIPTVKGDKGEKGDTFTYDDFTPEQLDSLKGADGINGQDGVSPTIIENADNSDTVYKLDITDVNGTITTPNLMGQGGTSESGDENTIESISVNGTTLPITNKNVDITIPEEYDDTELRETIAELPTKEYVKEEITNAQLGGEEVDLSDYATTEYVDNAVKDVEVDLTGFATEEYVTDAIKDKADKTDVPSVDGLISEEKLTETLADYAKTTDLPDPYDDTALSDRVTANEEAITILSGSGEGSVTKTVDNALNKFATDISNDGVVNTYKELVDYAASHSSDVAEMVAEIADNTTAIEGLDTKTTTLETSLENKVEKEEGKGLFSGKYEDLTGTPTIPSIEGLATEEVLKEHTDNADIHVSTDDRTNWDGKAKVVEITSEDYENLSIEEKNDGTVYCISDAVILGNEYVVENVVTEGSKKLITSGAVYNEVEQISKSLSSQKLLLATYTSGLTANATNILTCAWQDYELLLLSIGTYANIFGSVLVPYIYFAGTNSGQRPIINSVGSNESTIISCGVYQNGEGSIIVVPSSDLVSATNYNIRIYGIIAR